MADNTIGWGQGSVNNTNDWGKGKANSTNDWGSIYANSPSGDTNIEGGSAVDLDSFIIEVNTANTGSGTTASNQFELPWIGTYDVDWGDGNTETGVVNTQTHTYSTAGTYDISVTATTGRIFFYNSSDEIKLIDIKQWGTCQWTYLNYAFPNTRLTTTTATDIPDLTNVGSFRYMFRASTIVDVTNINNWNVSNIADTAQMFEGFGMSFIGDLSNWNTSNFQNIELMFRNNTSFNSDISGWDVSSVTDMRETFYNCTSFNQPIGSWDTSSVLEMTRMFYNCDSFDQDISSWQVSQVTQFSQFMQSATGLSTANYDALLIAWDSQGAMSYSGTVDFGGSQYTLGGAAEAARTSLISKWGGIVDGGGVLDATTNLIASYNFDTDFTDYTGNNDAISHNSALISTNDYVVNKGLNNTQGTAYLTIPDSNDFSFTDGVNDLPFSISFWINFSTTNLQAIIWKGGGSSNREYRIQTADGFGNGFQIKVMSPTTDFISAVGFDSSPYSINTFYHLAFTYDGSGSETGLKIYVNGVDETTTTSQTGTYTGMVNSNFDTAIGVRGDTLSGLNSVSKIDELHVWKNRELSSGEVLEIYNTENGGTSILP